MIRARDLAAAVLKIHPAWTVEQINKIPDWVLREIVFHPEKMKRDGNPLQPRAIAAASEQVKFKYPGYKGRFWATWESRGISESEIQRKWNEYEQQQGRSGSK